MAETPWWVNLFGIIGLALCGGAIVLLAQGEDAAIQRYLALVEGAGQVIEVNVDKIDPANDGRLIYSSDYATTDETLSDPVFGVSIQGLVLARKVFMYQWDERKRTNDGKPDYYMTKVWSNRVIDTATFKDRYHRERYQNPPRKPFPSADFAAQNAWLGVFKIPPQVLLEVDELQDLPVSTAMLPEALQAQISTQKGEFYFGPDPAEPRIGDARVVFTQLPQTRLSVAARQAENQLQSFQTQNGQSILLVKAGAYTVDDLFGGAQRGSAWQSWPTRLGGFLLSLVGLFLLTLLLAPVREWLQQRKTYVRFVTPVLGSFTVLCLVIAVKWLPHWSVFGGIMLGAGLIICAGLGYLLSQKKTVRP